VFFGVLTTGLGAEDPTQTPGLSSKMGPWFGSLRRRALWASSFSPTTILSCRGSWPKAIARCGGPPSGNTWTWPPTGGRGV